MSLLNAVNMGEWFSLKIWKIYKYDFQHQHKMGQPSHLKDIQLEPDFNMFQYINVFKESQSKRDLVRHESINERHWDWGIYW